jgi:hypothetical protein
MEVRMDDKAQTRTGLAEKAYKLALVGIPLLTAIINLISKVVNYACAFSKLRLPIRAKWQANFCPE